MISRLPSDKHNHIDAVLNCISDVAKGSSINQVIQRDNAISISFGSSNANEFNSDIGLAILKSAFDANPDGKTPGTKSFLIRRLPSIFPISTIENVKNTLKEVTNCEAVVSSGDAGVKGSNQSIHDRPVIGVNNIIEKSGWLMKEQPLRIGIISPRWERRWVTLKVSI